MDQKRREFFNEKIPLEEKESKPLFQILSLNKSVFLQEIEESNVGIRQTRSIELKFKINEEGEFKIPHSYIYLYDGEKKLVQRLERILIKETTADIEINPFTFKFKGKKTYILQFAYTSDISFKYYLAVLGDTKNISVEVEPGHDPWSEFDFEEKGRIQDSET